MLRLFVILLLVLIASCTPLKKYQDSPEVKAWEPDISRFELLDKTEKYPIDAVLFAGSSSIRLWETLKTDMSPYPVIQRGYGGARLSDFAVYADRILSGHQCRAAVFFIANDIIGSAQDKTPQEVERLVANVFRTFRKSHPETPFFWIGITPTESRWKVWPRIQKSNDLISDFCSKHRNTYFIRTDFAFLNEKGEPRAELFGPDKLHLNNDGYKVWSAIIKSELDKVLNDR